MSLHLSWNSFLSKTSILNPDSSKHFTNVSRVTCFVFTRWKILFWSPKSPKVLSQDSKFEQEHVFVDMCMIEDATQSETIVNANLPLFFWRHTNWDQRKRADKRWVRSKTHDFFFYKSCQNLSNRIVGVCGSILIGTYCSWPVYFGWWRVITSEGRGEPFILSSVAALETKFSATHLDCP